MAMPAAVIDLLKRPNTTKVLVTCGEDGQPHAIVCGSIFVIDDKTLGVGEVLMKQTVKNMEYNKKIAIEVVSGTSAYEIRGKAIERQDSGPGLDALNANLEKMHLKANAMWIFSADEVYDEGANPNAGKKIA